MTLSADLTVDASAASLRRLVGIARVAGAEILRWYGGTGVVEFKGDGSPLTVADRAANDLVVRELRAWTPRVPIVSEEDAIPAFEERQRWPAFWLVDPLDGTKEFLSGNGEFTVNIALITDRAPVLGVVFAPALGQCWYGGLGLGSWVEGSSGSATRIYSSSPAPGQPLVIVESRSHPSDRLEQYLKTVPVSTRIRAGSSLKFCLVAEGKADLYPRFGPTMEWDVAAGDCVYRNSGRDEPRRSSLVYNQPTLTNGDFVLGG